MTTGCFSGRLAAEGSNSESKSILPPMGSPPDPLSWDDVDGDKEGRSKSAIEGNQPRHQGVIFLINFQPSKESPDAKSWRKDNTFILAVHES